ncbi:MAG: prepilin-type N-terminal cleavage/methylation domain-containing protein [Patescibacteria group bacterium]|mgnify:CR=1 FL=1
MTGIKKKNGFTLIETVVATFVFSVVVIASQGVFGKALTVVKSGTAAQRVQESAQYALELMARDIRVSSVSADQEDALCALSQLILVHPVLGSVVYRHDSTSIERTVGGTSGHITADDVLIQGLSFCVRHAGVDGEQTRVTILIDAVYNSEKTSEQKELRVQTTVSLRDYETE